jgi:DHA3 family tetracycline resistance protein-like MFS transporter
VADEVGEAQAGEAFLRGAQASWIGALVAIPISVALGSLNVQLPIVAGGASMIVLAGFLAVVMSEEGFQPTPPGERTTWHMMAKTVRDARGLVARQPVLLALLAIGLFYGLYSEGLDRLWTPHLLETFAPPFGGRLSPVVWLGGLRAVLLLGGLAASEMVRRRVDTAQGRSMAGLLAANATLIVAGLAVFGLARQLWLAVAAFWLVGTLRRVAAPLHETWFNRRIDDPQVRATLFSATSQVDALGQIVGGPGVGAVGNVSIRAALVLSALLLAPVVPLYRVASRREMDTTSDAEDPSLPC